MFKYELNGWYWLFLILFPLSILYFTGGEIYSSLTIFILISVQGLVAKRFGWLKKFIKK